jgi:phage-related tail fiber protein
LRGEFIRAFDGGRGADPARIFGSWQKPSLGVGDLTVTSPGVIGVINLNNNHIDFMNGMGFDAVQPDISLYSGVRYCSAPATQYGNLGDGVVGYTRPRNIALLPCIKF